jgi:hypothetical protein
MNSRQLKDLLTQLDSLKRAETSSDYQAGVDAAQTLIERVLQEALDRERIQKLEAELAELRAKYPDTSQATPKRRGRRAKSTQHAEGQ